MNIVILGAGTIGTSIARALCARHHNVCVVDQSKAALSELQDRLDVTDFEAEVVHHGTRGSTGGLTSCKSH